MWCDMIKSTRIYLYKNRAYEIYALDEEGKFAYLGDETRMSPRHTKIFTVEVTYG